MTHEAVRHAASLGVSVGAEFMGVSEPIVEPLGRQSNLGKVQGLKLWQRERIAEEQIPLRGNVLGDAGRFAIGLLRGQLKFIRARGHAVAVTPMGKILMRKIGR
jgi:hypothetical protein